METRSLPGATPPNSFEHVRGLAQEENERLVVVVLNRKHRAIGRETLYKGTVAGAPVRIAELFRAAIRLNGSGILRAHSHPSGDATPSPDDVRTTRDAIEAGRLLGVEVVDHIVVGDPSWVSMRCEGRAFR